MSSTVGLPASRHSILQYSGLMIEQARVLLAFRADIKAYLRLVMCPIHRMLVTFWLSRAPEIIVRTGALPQPHFINQKQNAQPKLGVRSKMNA